MKHLFLISLLFLSSSVFARQATYSPPLTRAVHLIYQFEESRKIITQVEKEGGVHIHVANLGKRGTNALWDPSNRTIVLNTSKPRTDGINVRSILFELHNALSTKHFDYYGRLARERKISKWDYVEAIERIEHNNALHTVTLLNSGIQQNVFPQDARWNIAPSFEEHFALQKQSGHSGFIAKNYDSMHKSFLNEPDFQAKT
ncbi:MAG: hypothetical protein WAM28_03855 [Chlamydiales bacterium]